MHFRDLKAFDETVAKFKAFSEEEKAIFGSTGGFSSYANEFTKTLVKLNNAKDKSEYDKIVSQNQDILEANQDGMLIPKVGDRSMNDFVNRKGLIYIGKVLYKFGKTEQRIAFDGNASTLDNEEESKQLLIMKLPTSVKNARRCFEFYTRREQNGNRRATAYTSVSVESFINGFTASGPTFTVKYNFRMNGRPQKKNLWGTFVNYDTDNRLTAAFEYGVYPLNFGGQSQSGVMTDDVSNNNQYSIQIDRSLEFGFLQLITEPMSFVNEHVVYVDDLGSLNNTYGTRGVNTFKYECL